MPELTLHLNTAINLVPFLLLHWGFIEQVSGQCSSTNKTAFLRADNRMIKGFNGSTVPNADLRSCAELCSKNKDDKGANRPCSVFQFGTSCSLGNVNAQPFGNGVLTPAGQTAVYQKVCIPTTKVCDKPFAFDWVPQTVLLGLATQVHQFPTVSECLKACLESADNAPCRSAMFFFESEQCILNTDDRKTRPDLFSNDTQGLIVDYFENACIQSDAGSGPDSIAGASTIASTLSEIEVFGPETESSTTSSPTTTSPQIGVPAPSGYTASSLHPDALLQTRQPYSYDNQPYGPAPSQSYVPAPALAPVPAQSYVPAPAPVPGGPPLPIYCDHSLSTQFVSTENMGVQEGTERILQVDADTCRRLCENNKNENGQVAGCQAFSLDPTTNKCTLTSGLSMPRGSLHLVERNGVKFYEKVCLAHAHSCNGNFPFIRIPAHVLVGHAGEVRSVPDLSGCLDACLYARTETGYDCRSVMYYYSTTECILNTETRTSRPELFSGDTQGLFVDYFDNNCIESSYTPAYTPAYIPAPSPSNYIPSPITYEPAAQLTYPTGASPPSPAPYQTSPQPGPYPSPQPLPGPYPSPIYQTTSPSYQTFPLTYVTSELAPFGPSYTRASFISPGNREREEGIKNGQSLQTPTSSNDSKSDKATFSTDCSDDGINVNAAFKSPMSGVLYAKNKLQTCKEEFKNVNSVVLKIPLSGNEKDCGQGQREDQYSFAVVLQLNGAGVQGLMTSEDTMYNVNCVLPGRRPVANVLSGVTKESPREDTTAPSTLRETIEGGSKNSVPDARVTMDLLRDGTPVSNLLLGEQVEIRWRTTAPANIGFFIRDCSAERVGGTPPDPQPLQLIKSGCPEAAIVGRIVSAPIVKVEDGLATNLTVFRFDGSRSVRLRCLIDVCAGECSSTRCNINNLELQSYGRRKRATLEISPSLAQRPSVNTSMNETKTGTAAVSKTTVYGVFTIIDSMDDGKKQDSVVGGEKLSRFSPYIFRGEPTDGNQNDEGNELENAESKTFLVQNGELCLVRPLFVGLMTTLAILCTAEGLVVTACFWTRYRSRKFSSTDSQSSNSDSTDPIHKRIASVLRRFFAAALGVFSNPDTAPVQSFGMIEMNGSRDQKAISEKHSGSNDNIQRRPLPTVPLNQISLPQRFNQARRVDGAAKKSSSSGHRHFSVADIQHPGMQASSQWMLSPVQSKDGMNSGGGTGRREGTPAERTDKIDRRSKNNQIDRPADKDKSRTRRHTSRKAHSASEFV